MTAKWLVGLSLAALSFSVCAQPREVMSLSDNDWSITLDVEAQWKNDSLFLPPVEIGTLPVNLPTGGWPLLDSPQVESVHLPATVEEYLWGWNGDTFGINGDYVGVSWFETRVNVPDSWKGRHVMMDVEATRYRAEIFVNHHLAGYDVVNSTPYSFDIGKYLDYGTENVISFRITDPCGNFEWRDVVADEWGADFATNSTHGFGGIIGDVSLVATSDTYVEDVSVLNRPEMRRVAVEACIRNTGDRSDVPVPVRMSICECGGKEVWSRTVRADLKPGANNVQCMADVPSAKLWSVDSPNLYEIRVTVGKDSFVRRFGFRWFEVRDNGGDKQFFLNGKRIVLRSAISWGFWPENGLMPSREMAFKQVEAAKRLGLNMLNFHRCIGNRRVLDAADELGLLYFEEPGGNYLDLYPELDARYGIDDQVAPRGGKKSIESKEKFFLEHRDIKVDRMIRRDRSHPSLVIYNLHNENDYGPTEEDYRQMRDAHRKDPSRILLYNSGLQKYSPGANEHEMELCRARLMPYDTAVVFHGWYDYHNAGGPGSYSDVIYQNPHRYKCYSENSDEIIFYGEEGAMTAPARLEKIRSHILGTGAIGNWESRDYLDLYDAYEDFLDRKGFRETFPTVDSLTTAVAYNSYYCHGRMLENARIDNITDAYVINGWEEMKLENHSGIVDVYRNHKCNPDLIAAYNRPLYLSVKLNYKVLETGMTSTADIFIVNENDVRGQYVLDVEFVGPDGSVISSESSKVKVAGGDVYGQLLLEGLEFRVDNPGYNVVRARLVDRKGHVVCEGADNIFAVRLDKSGIPKLGTLADDTGNIRSFLDSLDIRTVPYAGGVPQGDYMICGDYQMPWKYNSYTGPVLKWVAQGHTLIIIGEIEKWGEYLTEKEVMDYRGSKTFKGEWMGANFINKRHPLFEGLPQAGVMGWEYQCFSNYRRVRKGIRCENGETVAAALSEHKKEVYSALQVVNHGRGRIIFCTFDMQHSFRPDEGIYEEDPWRWISQWDSRPSHVVGQQLLLNMMKY